MLAMIQGSTPLDRNILSHSRRLEGRCCITNIEHFHISVTIASFMIIIINNSLKDIYHKISYYFIEYLNYLRQKMYGVFSSITPDCLDGLMFYNIEDLNFFIIGGGGTIFFLIT